MNHSSRHSRRSFSLLLAAALPALWALPRVAGAAPPTPAATPPTPPTPPTPDDPAFPSYLLSRVDDLHRGQASHALMRMEVKAKHWERSMKIESWSLGEDYSLIRILEPRKEMGTATLKSGKDLFSYLSKTGRTIKIGGASMGGSWMGSHFTNDDLIRDNRLADNFDFQLETGPTIEGEPTWAVILTPKHDAAVVWGRIDVLIRKSDLLPAGQLFYDEDLDPVRKLEFSDYRDFGGRRIPGRMRMTPLDKPEEYTQMTYESIDFDIELDPSFFSVQQLKAL